MKQFSNNLGEEGQVISTLIVAIPILALIFLVFFTLTVTQSRAVTQVAADAAVLRIQEYVRDNLPEDDPDTPDVNERVERFIEMVTTDELIQQGRIEVYRRLCPSSRWIVGDACADWGTNRPIRDIGEGDDREQDLSCDGYAAGSDARERCESFEYEDCAYDSGAYDYERDTTTTTIYKGPITDITAKTPPRPSDATTFDTDEDFGRLRDSDAIYQRGYLRNWPDVKVWIAYPALTLPPAKCVWNPLSDSSLRPTIEAMLDRNSPEYVPMSEWRVVVTVEVRPVVPGFFLFFVETSDTNPRDHLPFVGGNILDGKSVSCAPLVLLGSDSDLWGC